jgi:hypothetical protein
MFEESLAVATTPMHPLGRVVRGNPDSMSGLPRWTAQVAWTAREAVLPIPAFPAADLGQSTETHAGQVTLPLLPAIPYSYFRLRPGHRWRAETSTSSIASRRRLSMPHFRLIHAPHLANGA